MRGSKNTVIGRYRAVKNTGITLNFAKKINGKYNFICKNWGKIPSSLSGLERGYPPNHDWMGPLPHQETAAERALAVRRPVCLLR